MAQLESNIKDAKNKKNKNKRQEQLTSQRAGCGKTKHQLVNGVEIAIDYSKAESMQLGDCASAFMEQSAPCVKALRTLTVTSTDHTAALGFKPFY